MPSFFKSKFTRRTGTTSAFAPKDTPKVLPPVQEERVVQERTTEQDKQKDVEDTDAQAVTNQDDAPDKNASKPSPSQIRVNNNLAKNKIVAQSQDTKTTPYGLLWSRYLSFGLSENRYTDRASFVPNAMSMFKIIDQMLLQAGRTNAMSKHYSHFVPYACKVGFSFLYYIQILRARDAASALTSRERSVLTRFSKTIPLEKIIIPGPLVPFMESIVATELEDVKYQWIVPSYGAINYAGLADMHGNADINIVRPMLPHMLAILNTFVNWNPTTLANQMDENGTLFIPGPMAGSNVTYFNHAYDFRNTGAMSDQHRIFLASGVNERFEFFSDDYPSAQRSLRRTGFTGSDAIDLIAVPTNTANLSATNGATLIANKAFTSIENFMFLEKDKNPIWFDPINEQLTILALFFENNKTMAEISRTGGLETLITCDIRSATTHANTDAAGNAINIYKYADAKFGHANPSTLGWYNQNHLRNLTGYFSTSRQDIERSHELQAFATAINALPHVKSADPTHFRTGSVFAQINAGDEEQWVNAVTYADVGSRSLSSRGEIPLFDSYDSYVRAQFTAKPSNLR